MLRIELTCDAGLLGCYSHARHAMGPQATARHDYDDLVPRIETLEDQALVRGWARVDGEFLCPACKIMRPVLK